MWVYGETEGMPKARGLLDNFIKAHSEHHTLWKTIKTAQNFEGSSQNLLGAEKQLTILVPHPTLRCPYTKYTSQHISIAVLAFKMASNQPDLSSYKSSFLGDCLRRRPQIWHFRT